MLSRMLGPLSVICLGAVAMYVFFAALGGISPSEVILPTIVVGVLCVLFAIRALVSATSSAREATLARSTI